MAKNYEAHQVDPFLISRSKVDLFLNCPRCFYLDVKLGIKRPPGYPFNLNNAVDALLKKEFDFYRQQNQPHPYMIEAGINATPLNHEKIDEWRSRKGIKAFHEPSNLTAYGIIDDIWIDKDTEELIIVDYKATSKADEVTLDADWQIGYKRQMEFYQWLFRANGFKVAKKGWFVYCNGIKDREAFNNRLDFNIKMLPYEGNTSWVESSLEFIKNILDINKIPDKHDNCDYCNYTNRVKEVLE